MTDKNVNLGCLIAGVLWMTSVLLLAVAWRLDAYHLSMVGVVTCGIAVTATIRCYFVKHNQIMRNVFELGRDSAEFEDVHSIR